MAVKPAAPETVELSPGAGELAWRVPGEPDPAWADLYAEKATEQLAAIGADGALRISARSVSGLALRVTSPERSCFLQAGLRPDGKPGALAGDTAGLVPGALMPRVRQEMAAVTQAVREFAGGTGDWLAGARELLAAARESALAAGAASAQARVWLRHRCYATSAGDRRARQVSSVELLTVSARQGRGRGVAGVADVPAAPLTRELAAQAGARAAAQAVRLAGAAPPASGDGVVIFAPAAAGVLVHEVVGHALEADTARQGSPLWAARGSRLTHPALSITDDPLHPWACERVDVDEEGTACRPASLLRDGVVAGVMTDRASAASLRVPATGHARRGSYTNPPIPRMWHTVTAAGPDSGDAILGGTARGILVTAIDTADAIPGQGRYSLRVLDGREIVNGAAGRALTDFTVSGSLLEFGLIDAVGRDPAASVSMCGRQGRWLPVSCSSPTLRFPRLSVRGSGAAS
jgi:TldD protein